MGTIAEKGEYLNNTKLLLKQKINNLGGDIDNNTTFRQYSEELQDIYDNLPKATGEGTEVSLNTVKGRMLITEKGNTIQDGTPTPDNEIPIKVVTGENTVIVGGINKYSSEIEQGGFFSTGLNAESNNRIRSKDYIEVKPNTTYTISANTITSNTLQVSISEYTQNDYTTPRINSTAWTTLPYTFTTQSNTKYIRNLFKFSNENNLVPSDVNLVQLQTGSTATPYEPYISPLSKQLDLGSIELCKIGNYQDYIYKSNDKWYKKEYIGKHINNGTQGTFSKPSTNRFNIDDAINDYLKAANIILYMSNEYKCYIETGDNASFNTLVANENYGLNLSNGNTSFVIRIKDTNYDNVDNYKTWLSTHNLVFYYVLATSQDIEITNQTLISQLNAIDNLMSNNGTTIISSECEEGNSLMILDVSALKGA